MKYAALLLVCAIFAAMLYVRFAPIDYERFVVDPETADRPDVSGHVLVREGGDIEPPVFDMPANELLKALDKVILATPRAQRISSSKYADVRVYVTKSSIWQFPDVASVKVISLPDGRSTLNIISRLVYGVADLGANRKRVEGWLQQLN